MSSNSMTLSVRYQRWVVFAVVYLLAAATVWFAPFTDGGRAEAQPANSNYQPFACSQNGGGDRRQSIDLSNDTVSGTTSGKFYPCISGVPFMFQIGNLTNKNANSNDATVVAQVDGVYATGDKTLSWAASGSSGLEYLAFKNLNVCTGTNSPISGCKTAVNNNDSNVNNNLAMFAYSSGTANPKPKTDYVLRLKPDGPATIGGNGVITDMVVTGDSKFSVNVNQITAGALGCTLAGGSVIGGFAGIGAHTCQGVTVSNMAGLAWVTGVKSYSIRQLDLLFYYLSTHAGNTTDPYTQPPMNGGSPANSLSFPNTRISVCPTATECDPAL